MAKRSKPPPQQTGIRDRIRELRRVRAADLVPHPKNARKHPEDQRRWVSGLLRELGYADALVGRELDGGRVQILDGHLRAEITPEQEVPILIVDLDDREAELLLATHDQVVQLGEIDPLLQLDLLRAAQPRQSDTQEYLRNMIALLELKQQNQTAEESPGEDRAQTESAAEETPPEQFSVVIDCDGEEDQRALFERMKTEGRKCRLLTL